VLEDMDGRLPRLRFSRVYTGSEAANYAAVAVAGDGSLIRARIDAGTLYTQCVTSPGAGSTFTSWTSQGSVSTSGAVALAVHSSDVYLFFVHADTLQVQVRVSTDNGATYGGATTIATAASAVTYLAAAVNGSGDRVVFWTVGAAVWRSRYTAGAWGAATAWTKTVASLTGIAATWAADFYLVITGTESTTTDAKCWAIIFGDGIDLAANTWGSFVTIASAVSGSTISFHQPALVVAGSAYRAWFIEKRTGSVASRRLQRAALDGLDAFSDDRWREPEAFGYAPANDFGVAAAFASSKAWLSTPAGVWLATIDSIPDLDASADVLAVDVRTEEYGADVQLTLRNEDGRYTSHAAVARGMRLALAPGHKTSAGAETAAAWWYWVEAVELVTGPRPVVVLHCRDAWNRLERWRARRTFAWSATTVSTILHALLAKAGLRLSSDDASSAIGSLTPSFTLHPGESGLTAVRRLLAMVPDELRMDQATARIIEPETGDATDYAYGAGHAIVGGRYRDPGSAVNRARVVGASNVVDDAYDQDEIDAVGERTALAVDANLSSGTLVTNRAAYLLRDAEVRERRDELQTFGVNCGQELYDVVEVTDAQAGLSAAKRRVLGLRWRYETSPRPRYDMTLYLGTV
jgi:hypothetical protein